MMEQVTCGEWTGLQALFLNDCPFAYYVYSFACRLQLALMAARKVIPVSQFFSKMALVINLVDSSCKRHDQLNKALAEEIAKTYY